MSKKLITKSIRVTPEESEDILQLSEACAATESALMKKWVQEGIQTQKLDIAIQAYINNETDLRGGAAMAEVSYNRFYREIESRNIVILDETYFLDELEFLADSFGNEALQKAVKTMRTRKGT